MAVLELWQEFGSFKSVLQLTLGLGLVLLVYSRLTQHIKIRRLGHYAPQIKSYMPWGMDLMVRLINSIVTGQDLPFLRDSIFKPLNAWTVETRITGRRLVFTADPANIKAVLATQFEDFGKGETFHQEFEPFLGDSIFVTDGQQWHDSRQLIRPSFTKSRVSDLHCFEDHTQTLFKAIANGGPLSSESQVVDLESGDGRTVNMKDLFFRFTLDVTTEFLMGEDLKSLMKPREPFMEAFDDVQRWQTIVARTSFLRHLVWKPRYWNGIKVMDEFVEHYVKRALEMSPDKINSDRGEGDKYSFLKEVAGYTRDPKVIRDQVVAVLLAGRDTTAGTLCWTIYEMSKRPDVVAKLRAEILQMVGGIENKPTYEHLKNMPYLKAILNEVLRLYPSVPANVRLALKDTTLPRGGGPDGDQPVAVLKETPVSYYPLVMQRRPELYPPISEKFADPGLFEPERWFHWHPKPHDYIPFNAGPRICIGQQFALTEMSYVLCRLFQRFDRLDNHTSPSNGPEYSPATGLQCDITLAPRNPVFVAFWKAKGV